MLLARRVCVLGHSSRSFSSWHDPVAEPIRLKIKNIPRRARPEDLLHFFKDFSLAKSMKKNIEIMPGRDRMPSALGAVYFDDKVEALRAADKLSGAFLGTHPLLRYRIYCFPDFPERGMVNVNEKSPGPVSNKNLKAQMRDKVMGGRWPKNPWMAPSNEQSVIVRYKTCGRPRAFKLSNMKIK